ncbi:MAG: hypothetical protein V1492_02630 [Candidatus Micrarchaeota archaeon]
MKNISKKTAENEGLGSFFYIGLVGMLILIAGVLLQPGSLLQKSLFLLGAVIMTMVALQNKQKMLSALQIIIVLGNVFSFFPSIEGPIKYGILVGASLIGVTYLVLTKYYQEDKFGLVGSCGLLMLAVGFATDAVTYPLYFGFLLGVGSLLVAAYSFTDYYYHKNRTALIWVILNIVFAISPLLMVVSILR